MKTTLARLADLKEQLGKVKARYLLLANSGTVAEVRSASQAVRDLQAAIALLISDGAKPCPGCGQHPFGMEQPRKDGGTEFEIGCLSCKPFKWRDGTVREYRVRGGLVPRHAVDAWNEGPDCWRQRP